MRNFLSCFLFALLVGAGCRSGTPDVARAEGRRGDRAAGRLSATALRVKPSGGDWEGYRLPSLAPIPGTAGRLPRVDSLVGVDGESETLYLRTVRDDILALDLVAGRLDTVARRGPQATLGPDGTLFVIDERHHVTSYARRARRAWPDTLPGLPAVVFAAAGQRLLGVIRGDDPLLFSASAEQPAATQALAATGPVAATRWGELVAAGNASGVLLLDPHGRRPAAFIPLRGESVTLTFSPSGHRLYVLRRDRAELAVIDRFARRVIDDVALPGPASDIRLDPLGRWLLARPATGDSAWVVDLPTRSVTGSIPTSWRADLPAVAPDGTVLVRQGDDVVAIRLDSLTTVSRVAHGASDLWLVSAWRPRGTPSETPSDAATADQEGGEGPLYVQVSVSQNQAWSAENAQQLVRAGLPARVLPPRSPEDGYRVVLGPYPTRAEAETMGRKLGRPYWIYQADEPR